MLELLISVILSVAPISLHQKPYAYHINIAHAQTASLASSLLAISDIPHPPLKSLALEENSENTAYYDFDTQSSPEAIVERKTLGVEEIKDLIRQYFPDEPLMVKIVACESQYIPDAKNKTSSAKGLLQILDGTWKHFKCEGDVLNAEDNLACGVKILNGQGLSAWSESFKNCWKNI